MGRDSEVVEEREIFVDCLCRSRGGNNSSLVEERKLNFENEEGEESVQKRFGVVEE